MKNFKRISLFLLVCVFGLVITGCGNSKEKNVEGSLEEIMAKLYLDIPEDERPKMLMNTEVTQDNVEYYLGTSTIDFKEALASEPGISSIAHSVVLVRLNDGVNAEETKKLITDNVKPNKWLCVEAEKVTVLSKGDLVLLVMADTDTVTKIETAFNNL